MSKRATRICDGRCLSAHTSRQMIATMRAVEALTIRIAGGQMPNEELFEHVNELRASVVNPCECTGPVN